MDEVSQMACLAALLGGGPGHDNGGVDGGATPPFVGDMDKEEPPPGPQAAPPRPAKAKAKADRLAREAAALRHNLRRRKDQARQRSEAADQPNAGVEEA